MTPTAPQRSGDGVEALLKDFQYQCQDISTTQTFKTELRDELVAAIELLLLEARISEMEQAWDWAVQQNRSHIKGDFVLKRIRKLKALQSNQKEAPHE